MTNQTTETARALLYRHGLPEDVIDGALCLHAQELAAVQRRDAAVWGVDTAAGKHVLATADLIDPARGATPVVPLPSADQAALRDRIADALMDLGHPQWDAAEGADAVLAVLPAPVGHATDTSAEPPLDPNYSHEACGFHWHGRDDMDVPMRDGQPVCPRCELAKVQKKLDHTQKMRDEVGVECKRRGKRVLEQSERVIVLERQVDEVQRQLGAEILRAGQAEAELRRVADETAATEAHPAEHTWAAELYDPVADEWVPGTRYAVRDRAVNHLAHTVKIGPKWKDGTPTQRRLVRATTTYTVEQPAAGTRQDGAQS
ncbi:hypothetical protein ADL07_11795 [Streptomyces sp. NRRL F-4707]|uniref:hypothetical protein n=1 Tax=Streptomyces sp. NRRL F-4707 TaxID=1519496 RepID=UPI0006B03802|nr:hypothetical protein [Streptomyces sp. NRRL F-4707]KOX32837.1 hypothetical protein ADL07_11795 [Streptomyces sp. NRRL F-4707]